MRLKRIYNANIGILLGLGLGIATGLFDAPSLNQTADAVSQVFINLLKLVSTPIIFLSILSTVSGMNNVKEFKSLGRKLIKYTCLTTYIAASIALIMYLVFDPASSSQPALQTAATVDSGKGYLSYIIQSIPSNIISPFSESHVISVLFLAILLSFGTLALPEQQRSTLHNLLSALNALFIKIASWIVKLIPIAIWSFITLFIKEIQAGLNIKQIFFYLLTITSANLIQGFIILPMLIKFRGLSPVKLAYNMLPALSLAFFSKSSSATLPMTMRCAEERAGMSKKLANLAFPLCTAINMNGCAAFILITVLFVSTSAGLHFSVPEMVLWTVIATIAAIGNAGVPMGCYFLSTAFLVAMNVPLNMMAIILPFYALLDMLETSINVWSDSCVVALVDQEMREEVEQGEDADAAKDGIKSGVGGVGGVETSTILLKEKQ